MSLYGFWKYDLEGWAKHFVLPCTQICPPQIYKSTKIRRYHCCFFTYKKYENQKKLQVVMSAEGQVNKATSFRSQD